MQDDFGNDFLHNLELRFYIPARPECEGHRKGIARQGASRVARRFEMNNHFNLT